MVLIRRGKYFQFKGLKAHLKQPVPLLTGPSLETAHSLAGKNFTNLDPLTPGSELALQISGILGTWLI